MDYSALVLVGLVVALAFMATNMTGYLVAGDKGFTKTWDFSNASEYTYNSSLIILDSGARLKANTTTTEHITTEVVEYPIAKALYNPSDKTEKLASLDSLSHEANEGKVFDIVFSSPLGNGDVVSFYLKKEKAISFYLCGVSESCVSPGYGNASFGGEEDSWVNITLGGLESPSSMFSIITDDDMKVDYITATHDLVGAYYDLSDKTNKLSAQDGEKLDASKNEILNIFFDEPLDDNYVVSLYLKGDKESEIVLCDTYLCSDVYASFSYPGEEGWYNATLEIDSPIRHFTINKTNEIKTDYIYAAHYNVTTYNVTNITYPELGEIETVDFVVQNLKEWVGFSTSESLNQNISYQYSTDSGLTWSDIDDLSQITSKTVRFKAVLISNTTETPVINSFSLDYVAPLPIFGENRNIKASPGDTVNITFNVTNPLLVSNATAYIKYTNGTVLANIPLEYNNQTLLFEGLWDSASFSGLYYIDAEVQSDYAEKMNQKQILSLISSTSGSSINSSIQLVKNQTLTINSKDTTNTILEITPIDSISNVTLSIVEYRENVKAENTKTALGKYIDIVADERLKANLSTATMTIYYNDSDLEGSGISEDSLKIHYFNDTSNEWEALDSVVNTTINYVTATTTHFSTYGIFGDPNILSSSSGGGSGGSGGSRDGSRKPKTIVSEVIPIETASLEAVVEKAEEAIKCASDVSLYLEEGKVFIKNSGSCILDSVMLNASPHLLQVIMIPEKIGPISPGEKEFIDLVQGSNLVILSSVTGLVVSSSEIYGGEISVSFFDGSVEKQKRLQINIMENKEPSILLPLIVVILVAVVYFCNAVVKS